MVVSLNDTLRDKRNDILAKWFEDTLATYPSSAQRIFTSTAREFANPVGETIKSGLEAVFDGLVAGDDSERLGEAIDLIIRMRSVQNFTAAEAVGFVFSLKTAVRASLPGDRPTNGLGREMAQFERRIDELALQAFDLYMACREQVYQIRANETKARSAKLFQRAQQIIEQHATGQKITCDLNTPEDEGGDRQ